VRSRRISTASTATRRSLKREDNVVEQDIIVPTEVRGRRPSTSRVTFTNASSSPTNGSQRFSTSKSNLSLRSNRTRTNSMTSSGGNQHLGSSTHLSSSSSLLPSNSQASLERVIGSRLLETFIVISILPKNQSAEDASQSTPSLTPKSSRSAPASKATFTPPSTRPEKNQKHSRGASGASIRSSGRPAPHSAHPTNTTFKSVSRADSGKTTSPRQIKKSTSLSKGKAMASASVEEESARRSSPIYFSPVHSPSTNPYFAIDARAGHDFPSGCDDVGQFMKIEIWGKMSISLGRASSTRKCLKKNQIMRNMIGGYWTIGMLILVNWFSYPVMCVFLSTFSDFAFHERSSATPIRPNYHQTPLFLLCSLQAGGFISPLPCWRSLVLNHLHLVTPQILSPN
jgi:hypothetical protein